MTCDDRKWLDQPDTETEEHVKTLLERVDAFISDRHWSEGYFSKLAAGDVNVVARLRHSGKVTGAKMAQIERYLAEAAPDDAKGQSQGEAA